MFKKSWRILIDLISVVSVSPFVESFIFLFWFHYFLKIEGILKKLKYYNLSHWEEELILRLEIILTHLLEQVAKKLGFCTSSSS